MSRHARRRETGAWAAAWQARIDEIRAMQPVIVSALETWILVRAELEKDLHPRP